MDIITIPDGAPICCCGEPQTPSGDCCDFTTIRITVHFSEQADHEDELGYYRVFTQTPAGYWFEDYPDAGQWNPSQLGHGFLDMNLKTEVWCNENGGTCFFRAKFVNKELTNTGTARAVPLELANPTYIIDYDDWDSCNCAQHPAIAQTAWIHCPWYDSEMGMVDRWWRCIISEG